ncbi:peroxide stress protein YaaA [Ichthyobacterium seriolicida]|uniref:UPF0246 protein JBKA6_0968 n=1 Tax=Ichthyobacterium seriolicida TaxID=242600 RepID=A0A1J1E202_9FLAO|nr:peroxide stress protein YaaA [Ichthyobacterium seriolicida]BAV94981.1 hypothetical protein JBKA6_0968 [Ichthyobacterium seriolicida]
MKIIISPAKSMDSETSVPIKKFSNIFFEKESSVLNSILKKKSVDDLSSLMNISKELAELNWDRNHSWEFPFSQETHRQAIYTFNGPVFKSINPYQLESIDYLQENLLILSGLYGILKPLDLIHPYRLEMGTKLSGENFKNLYDFWQEKVSCFIKDLTHKEEIILNLASEEYFKVINSKILSRKIITPIFKELKNGKLKTIPIYSKMARGFMVRFAWENQIKDIEQIKLFKTDGYTFDENLSNDRKIVFIR